MAKKKKAKKTGKETGKELELRVAQAYRDMGTWKVEHDVSLAGNQIDVYVELVAACRLLHHVAVEAKDWRKTVGIRVVNDFAKVVKQVRDAGLIDQGVIVSESGFTRPAREAAQSHGIRLLALADLDAAVAEAKEARRARPTLPRIPRLPMPYFAHAYPMQENFTGRVCEREMLTQWLTEDTRPLLTLTAPSGMGKSAVAWAWLQRDVLGLPLPGLPGDGRQESDRCRVPQAGRPEGVMWWSFHGREAGFAKFLDGALAYASGGDVDLTRIPSTYDKAERLVDLIRPRRLLLILDGFEQELRAYASLSAPYQGDAVTEDERGDFRSSADPPAGDFVRRIAAESLQSRVLLTSRLFPRELDGLAGCRRVELTALDPQDAEAFFRAQGVEGTPREIQATCRPSGYQPLALRLLSSVIVGDKEEPGDIRVAERYRELRELKESELRQILQVAYDALDPSECRLLSAISAFRSPVSSDALSIFDPYKREGTLDSALKELIERGLLLFDSQRGCYDLHPVVRAYAYEQLENKVDVHNRLRDYFAALPVPKKKEVQSVEDLAPIIELYHDTVSAGEYDEARRLYEDRLRDLLYYRLGAYQTCIELLGGLFPDGEDRPPRLKKETDQAWTLKELAKSYSLCGHVRRAVQMLTQQIKICKALGDWKNLPIGLRLLAHQQVNLGELAPAEAHVQSAIELSREIKEELEEARDRGELGRVLAFQGDFDGAAKELDKAYQQLGKIGSREARRNQGLVRAYRAICALLQDDPETGLKAAQRAWKLAYGFGRAGYRFQRDIIRAEWLLGEARVALAKEERGREDKALADPEGQLTNALEDCRRINLVEQEMDILLARARLYLAKGDVKRTLEDAEEALAIADRCEYRLKQADCHNFLGSLAMDEGDKNEAKKQAKIAYERAWCDGPPHCYKPALDEAKKMLKELGAKPPKME